MRFRINKKIGAAAAVNLLALAGFLTLALIGFREGAAQEYNYAAQRWSGEDSADEIRYGIISALQDISIVQEDGCRLCPDAYSAEVGQLTVTGSKTGSSECEITAVGGDFFTIHNFRLLDGAFFTDDDIMQDGAVIDENLAWALFGSCEVSGMDITINGTQFYVSGVVEAPQTEAEAECAGEMPRAYISYEGASGFASGETDTESESAAAAFKTVTCYEVLMPDPVEDFAYDTVSQLMEEYGEGVSVILNSGRFEPLKRLGALKGISSAVVRSDGISYPYWENASRIVEFRLSYIYLSAAFCLIIPAGTVIWLIARGMRKIYKKRKSRFKTKGLIL